MSDRQEQNIPWQDIGRGVSYADGPLDIRAFGVCGDGSDESVKIKAAHDTAAALGCRVLYFPVGEYVAPNLWNCGNVIFVGDGTLIGAYQKIVAPVAALPVPPPGGGMIPALHLKSFASAAAPVVCIMGDSTSTGVHASAATEHLWPLLQARILRDNPDRTISFINRGVPGATLAQAVGLPVGLVAPSWYTDPKAPWLSYVEAARPDLLFLNFGQNDPAGFDMTHLSEIIGRVRAWPKVPDIVLMTPLPRSVMADAGVAQRAAQEDRAFAAGALRTYAQANGFGLIDLHRAGTLARDGWDPTGPALERQQDPIADGMALPWTAGEATTDFELELSADNTGSAVFGGGRELEATLSRLGSNALHILQLGPRLWLRVYAGGRSAIVQVPNRDTGIAVPTGRFMLRVTAKGGFMSVVIDGRTAFEGLVVRHGGLFRPRVGFAGRSGDASPVVRMDIRRYAVARPLPSMPWVTDRELYGDHANPGMGFGGNGINHPAARGVALVHAGLLERTRFCAAEAGVPSGERSPR